MHLLTKPHQVHSEMKTSPDFYKYFQNELRQ